jgi:hypothetical protein
VGVVVRRNDGYEIAVKGNDGSGPSSDGVVLWIGGGKIETWLSDGESGQC